MAKAKKPTRKELLKEPDEFLTLSRRTIEFGIAHKTPILIGVAGFFALLLAVAGFQYYTIRAENRAFSLLREATAAYEAAAAGGDLKSAKEASAEAFETLLDRHAGRTAAKIGRVVYADICYRSGDPAAAAALYEEALGGFENDPALRNLIRLGLAYALEQLGDSEGAIASFRRAAEGQEPVMKEDALFQLAGLYVSTGRTEQGVSLYRRIAEEHPDSLYGKIAREQAARLGT